jgi:hypothetical protein
MIRMTIRYDEVLGPLREAYDARGSVHLHFARRARNETCRDQPVGG